MAVIGVDYLQLMRSHSKQAANSREREVAEISSGLKALAKELKVPVVVLAQLNRGPETRAGKEAGIPRMSDLRESGSIEQDADIVMFLYRDAYYNKDSPTPNISECIVAKNRHGETGTVKLMWDGQFTRFSNAEMRDEG